MKILKEIIIAIDEESCEKNKFDFKIFVDALINELTQSDFEYKFILSSPMEDTPYGFPNGISMVSAQNISDNEQKEIMNTIEKVFKILVKQYSEA